jgi:folylpolyglutamate synthase/dihydropteroate synthase
MHSYRWNQWKKDLFQICWLLFFQEAGYKVGLYTSPHLKDFRERIRINGEMIPEEEVNHYYQKTHCEIR